MIGPLPEPQLAQVAWAVRDLTRTCRFYTEVVGFRRAGGRLLWGPGLSILQDLGPDAEAILWWVVGSQAFVQLEFFAHSRPAGRARPSDARPSDLGWSRVRIGVADLGAVLARASARGHRPLGPIQTRAGFPSAALCDPDGVVVELVGDGADAADRRDAERSGVESAGPDIAPPVLRSVTLSVGDLERASRFWTGVCGLRPRDDRALLDPSREALWGMAGARRELLVARGGAVDLELVHYLDPPGRPRPPDHRLCDQGLLNVALAYRDREQFDALHARLLAAGCRASVSCPPGPFASTYLQDVEGNSFEIFACPEDHDPLLGFVPEAGFAPGVRLDP
ncbi:MAG: VOC family protein [Myxococcota bacterium]